MIPVLSTNRKLNDCQFTVINRALGYDSETVSLDLDADFVGSRAVGITGAATSKVEVATTTVGEVMATHGFERCGIVCDIEGAEAQLIEREFPELGERIRYIMAEFHPHIISRERTNQLFKLLRDMGFVEKETIGECAFYARS
jgi:FkbM family methyltransferase